MHQHNVAELLEFQFRILKEPGDLDLAPPGFPVVLSFSPYVHQEKIRGPGRPVIGCTQRGSYSAKAQWFCLLSSLYDTSASENPSKNLCSNPYKAPSDRTLLRSCLEALPLTRNSPTTTTTIFEFISRRPILQFCGTHGYRIEHHFYTMDTEKTQKQIIWCAIKCRLMLHQMQKFIEKSWLWLWLGSPWLKGPSKSRVLSHDPLGAHPKPPSDKVPLALLMRGLWGPLNVVSWSPLRTKPQHETTYFMCTSDGFRHPQCQGKRLLQKSERNLKRTDFRLSFAGDFLWNFWGLFLWKNGTDPNPKIYGNIRIGIWELRSQTSTLQGSDGFRPKLHTCAGTSCRATRVAADFLRILGFFRCSSSIALHPPPKKGPVAPVVLQLLGVSHVKLLLKRCRATRGCSSYTCGCRAKLCNYGFDILNFCPARSFLGRVQQVSTLEAHVPLESWRRRASTRLWAFIFLSSLPLSLSLSLSISLFHWDIEEPKGSGRLSSWALCLSTTAHVFNDTSLRYDPHIKFCNIDSERVWVL